MALSIKALHSKGNNPQCEKAVYGVGENTCKPYTDKEFISKINKELLKLNSKNTNDPTRKWAKENRNFSKEDLLMANRYINRNKQINLIFYCTNFSAGFSVYFFMGALQILER